MTTEDELRTRIVVLEGELANTEVDKDKLFQQYLEMVDLKTAAEMNELALLEAHAREIAEAERRGAERIVKLIKQHKPFVENADGLTICDECMQPVWQAWESARPDGGEEEDK